MGIQAVIFDIGNVLVEWHPFRPFDRIIGESARRDLFDRIPLMDMNDGVDLGASMAAEVERLAREHPADAEAILIWRDHWMEMLAPDIPESAQMLRALRRRGVAVHALSNFGAETLEMAERRYPILTEFDRRYVSGHLGMMKPDPAIFAHVESDLNLPGEALLFIDDRADNITAAGARGWRTHLFDGPVGLGQRLVAEGLLAEAEVTQ